MLNFCALSVLRVIFPGYKDYHKRDLDRCGICFQNCHIQDPNPGNASCGAASVESKCPAI